MKYDDILKDVGIDKKPKYWSTKYMRGIENLSKELYNVKKEEDVWMEVRDGTKLCVDIYRPDTEEDITFPGLVAFSAYGKSIQTMKRESLQFKSVLFDHTIEAGDIEAYVRRGYVVVIPDPRGIGKSEGAWDGLYGRQEQEDCYDVIEWTATLEYCTGNIGMIGISYFSILQPMVAALQPPHLRAIMMVEVVDNLYHHNYPGGVFVNRSFMYTDFCPAVRGISTSERIYTEKDLKARVEKRLLDSDTRNNALLTGILSCWPPKHQTYFFDVVLHNNDSEFWQERSIEKYVKDIKIPMYLVSEYYELGRFSQGPFFVYNNADPSVPRKVFAPEEHDALCLPHKAITEEYIRWYDYWLKGKDTGIMDEPPIKLLIRGIEKYRYEYEWPLARTKWTKFYLRKGGDLSTELEVDKNVEPDVLEHKSPYNGSIYPSETPSLVYRTEPLKEAVEVTGPITLYLKAAINVEDANFVVRFNDAPPEGRSLNLSTGCLRASHRAVETENSKPWSPVHDHTKNVPVVPGEINEYAIEIMNTSNVFLPGHCIEIEIKNTDPNEFHWMLQLPNSKDITYDIHVGRDNSSYLLLPVIPESPEENWVD